MALIMHKSFTSSTVFSGALGEVKDLAVKLSLGSSHLLVIVAYRHPHSTSGFTQAFLELLSTYYSTFK